MAAFLSCCEFMVTKLEEEMTVARELANCGQCGKGACNIGIDHGVVIGSMRNIPPLEFLARSARPDISRLAFRRLADLRR